MLEADNVGMRNDVKINYQLFVFPYRELVSDFCPGSQSTLLQCPSGMVQAPVQLT